MSNFSGIPLNSMKISLRLLRSLLQSIFLARSTLLETDNLLSITT